MQVFISRKLGWLNFLLSVGLQHAFMVLADVLAELLKASALYDIRNANGETAFVAAVRAGHKDAAAVLEEGGSNPHFRLHWWVDFLPCNLLIYYSCAFRTSAIGSPSSVFVFIDSEHHGRGDQPCCKMCKHLAWTVQGCNSF